jgi:hypothetical protein
MEKPLEFCVLLGNNLHITQNDYQLRLNILGIGEISTIMSPEEFAVINEVTTRMLSDHYFELTKKQYHEPSTPKLNVYRIGEDQQ